MSEATRKAFVEKGDNFRQFSRNGRWGTCVDCPRDTNGDAYPEFCVHTHRYDHNLSVDELAHNFKVKS